MEDRSLLGFFRLALLGSRPHRNRHIDGTLEQISDLDIICSPDKDLRCSKVCSRLFHLFQFGGFSVRAMANIAKMPTLPTSC